MQIQARQRIMQHNSIQMALAAGIDLNRGGSGSCSPVGIQAGGNVTIDHPMRSFTIQCPDGLFN